MAALDTVEHPEVKNTMNNLQQAAAADLCGRLGGFERTGARISNENNETRPITLADYKNA